MVTNQLMDTYKHDPAIKSDMGLLRIEKVTFYTISRRGSVDIIIAIYATRVVDDSFPP